MKSPIQSGSIPRQSSRLVNEMNNAARAARYTSCFVFLLAAAAVLAVVSSAVIFHFIPFEKPLFTALLLAYSLPAPFIVPLYADVTGHADYISTTLSVETILSILLFIALAAYTLM